METSQNQTTSQIEITEQGVRIGAAHSPGSNKALEHGCACPVLDNAHGRGYMGVEGVFVYSSLCDYHSLEYREMEEDVDPDSIKG